MHPRNAFATMLGAGFDIKISHHIALRLFEGDFLLTNFKCPPGRAREGWQKNVRFSSGIVFRFGGNPPATAAGKSCADCVLLSGQEHGVSGFRGHRSGHRDGQRSG